MGEGASGGGARRGGVNFFQYGKLIAIENEKWAKVIKFAGIKLD